MGTLSKTGADFPSDLLVDVHNGNARGIRERLEAALRGGIQTGRLLPGSPLPPTRVLAAELAISRTVVVEAYGNLKADGYVEARTGAGTRVRSDSPHDPLVRGRRERRSSANASEIRLFGGLPDPALFPRAKWARHYRAALSQIPDPELTYPVMLGAPELRTALAAYLGRVRGVETTAEQILVTSGSTQALTLTCRALRRRGARRVAVEDPCFALHRDVIAMTELEPVPVAVDRHGLDPGSLPSDVAAVLVAPAHSYPSGGTLDAARRHALVEWARRVGAVVIEDDYDAEFRYDRQPIGALQGLAPEHVVYIGCVSKTVTPALRLGWAAVPADLVDALECEKVFDDLGSTLLDQLAFARFVDSGDFSRHLRRVRPVYRTRRDATIAALSKHLPEASWRGEAAGLHLQVMLPDHIDEHELAAAAHERGVLVENGAWHWARPREAPPSIVIGYGAVPEPTIRRGIVILADALTGVSG